MSTFFPKSLWLWFYQCLHSKLLAQLLLDSSFLCKRLSDFIFHSLGWNYKIQTIRIYHTSTNLPVIRNLKIVHSIVRSTMQGRKKNLKSWNIICSPSWKMAIWSDTISLAPPQILRHFKGLPNRTKAYRNTMNR